MSYLKVKVIISNKKESITRIKPDTFLLVIKTKPERGLANKRVLSMMADFLGKPLSAVKIISGYHQPTKIIVVDD